MYLWGYAHAAARTCNTLHASALQEPHGYPKDTEVNLRLSKLDARLGHKKTALKMRRHALPLMPDDTANGPHFMCDWVMVLILAGERDETIRVLGNGHIASERLYDG